MPKGKHRRPIPAAERARPLLIDSAAVATTTAMMVAVGIAAVSENAPAHRAGADGASAATENPAGTVLAAVTKKAVPKSIYAGWDRDHDGRLDPKAILEWYRHHKHNIPESTIRAFVKAHPELRSLLKSLPAQPHAAASSAPAAHVASAQKAQPSHSPKPTPKSTPVANPSPKATTSPKPSPSSSGTAPSHSPSQTVSPSVKPKPSPTQVPAPSTSAPGGRPATSGPFPGSSNTGVPAGTALRSSGGLVITTPGTTLNGVDINGCVTIKASNVSITNSRIRCSTAGAAVHMVSGSLTMSHSEIDGMNRTDECIAFDNFTLNAVDIHGCVDGIKLGSNDVIKASYVHALARGTATHNDAIQTQGGSNDLIEDNTLMAYDAATNDPMNAAIQTGSMLEDLRNVTVRHNYMDGGNYTINAGGGSGADGHAVSNYVFTGNVFGDHARYGVIQGLGPGISFDATNVWAATARPVQ